MLMSSLSVNEEPRGRSGGQGGQHRLMGRKLDVRH